MNRTADVAGRVGNTLLLSSSEAERPVRPCFDQLLRDSSGQDALTVVAYDGTGETVVEDWLEHAGGLPARLNVIDVGGMVRSAEGRSSPVPIHPTATVYTVSPANLTALGTRVSDLLRGDDGRPVLCFDSVSMLLQYAEVETAYQFLHVLTGRVHAVDGVGYYHFDPSTHEFRTVEAVKSLFDRVVELD